MPPPKQWASASQLVREMKNCGWRDWFSIGRTKYADSDWERIATEAVGPNTFRAFAKLPRRPSFVFREWAFQSMTERGVRHSKLMEVNSQLEYDRWLTSFVASLCRYWNREMGMAIPFGPSFKLPNLLMKSACLWSEIPRVQSNRLIWYPHVPLDSYSIQAVRNCTDNSPATNGIGRIPASAGMGYVKDFETYLAFQELMRSLSAKANVPPIAIDILAWNAAH